MHLNPQTVARTSVMASGVLSKRLQRGRRSDLNIWPEASIQACAGSCRRA